MCSVPAALLIVFTAVIYLPSIDASCASHSRAEATGSVCLITESASVQEAITETNWKQHPKIKAVRTVVESVNTGRAKGFKNSARTFEYCEPYADTERKMSVDSKGIVRWYQKQGGSEDSSLTFDHYYDEAGRLRFVFIRGGATNGAKLEHRIYFDDGGNRIWEEHKYISGPEYTFPEVWPDEQLQKSDAAKAFAATSACPEQKRRMKNAR